MATPTIVDNTVPVVVFVGPPASGKSMILVRISKFLRHLGYIIEADRTFLPTNDYLEVCDEFESNLDTDKALKGNVTYLLVNVYDKEHRVIAKLLEAPGEDFFDPNNPDEHTLKSYLHTIIASTNKKTYVFLLDLDSKTSLRRENPLRSKYEQRILKDFYPIFNYNRDKIILLYNKIDIPSLGTINGCPNIKIARKDAQLYYPLLFSNIKRSWFGLFQVDNFSFLTFCTGMFSEETDDFGETYQTYNQASDVYPQELWSEIISKW